MISRAIEDSRAKAEILAKSMGCKIAGIDSANLSGDEDVYDVTEPPPRYVAMRMGEKESHPLSDSLKPAMIELSEKVKIVWLVEPLAKD